MQREIKRKKGTVSLEQCLVSHHVSLLQACGPYQSQCLEPDSALRGVAFQLEAHSALRLTRGSTGIVLLFHLQPLFCPLRLNSFSGVSAFWSG
jgi:hypothetical protein